MLKSNLFHVFHDEFRWNGGLFLDTGIQKYQAFVTAVECGSFTRAADMLHYSQSGISRMIHDLEAEWGVTLLERGKAGVRLTSDGIRLLPHAQRICQAYQALQTQVDALHGLQAGLIRIGTFSSVATHWLPRMIRAFEQAYPKIEYELLLGDYAEIESWVQSGRVDCGFIRLPAQADLHTFLLEEDTLMAVLPLAHPLAGAARVPIQALAEQPFIQLEKGGRAEAAEIFARAAVTPNIRFTTWDDYAVMSMVEQGLGVSILPALILRRIPYHIAVRPLEPAACRRIGLALRDEHALSPAVQRFLTYLPMRDEMPV